MRFQELVAKVVEITMIVDERMNGLSEDGGAANAGNVARETERARNFRRGDFDAQSAYCGWTSGSSRSELGVPSAMSLPK